MAWVFHMDEETRMDAQTIDGLVLLIDGIRGRGFVWSQATYKERQMFETPAARYNSSNLIMFGSLWKSLMPNHFLVVSRNDWSFSLTPRKHGIIRFDNKLQALCVQSHSSCDCTHIPSPYHGLYARVAVSRICRSCLKVICVAKSGMQKVGSIGLITD